jgi:ATP-dependent protease HslVU (ClpYQ) peptidase subunit
VCLAALTPPLAGPAPDSHSASLDGAFLIAREGRLWYLFAHLAAPVPGQIAALGVGCDHALGYMEAAIGRYALNAAQVVQDAVTSACRHTAYCAVPDGPLVETLAPAAEKAPADA